MYRSLVPVGGSTSGISQTQINQIIARTNALYVEQSGGDTITGETQITVTPTNPNDIVNKTYVDSKVQLYLPLTGGTMTGTLNMGSKPLTGLTNPVNSTDAVNLLYMTNALNAQNNANSLQLSGGTMTGVINMGSKKITNVADPSATGDAVNLSYLQAYSYPITTTDSKYLQLSGGTMTGTLNMGSKTLTGLTAPVNASDAVTLTYLQSNSLSQTQGDARYLLLTCLLYTSPSPRD